MCSVKAPKTALLGFSKGGQLGTAPHSRHSLRSAPSRITEAEIEVFEAWFGDLFDELFSTRH